MPRKVKTVRLSYPWPRSDTADGLPARYRVEQVTDSVEFPPGEHLEKRAVDVLCTDPYWRVTVIPAPK